jgi:ABC-type uncharacterized transport system ATPase subunit
MLVVAFGNPGIPPPGCGRCGFRCGLGRRASRPVRREWIRPELADGGMTVLLMEHDMEVVFGLANKITVLHPARASPTARRRRSRTMRR